MKKLFEFVTPLTLMAGGGLLIIGQGLLHLGEENNVLQFFFGVPLLFGAVVVHIIIWGMLKRNVLYIWLVEFVLVGLFLYAFFFRW